MPIIPQHRLVFQHLPRTGGNAICKAFNVSSDGHLHLQKYQQMVEKNHPDINISDWTTFTIIRDPVQRFKSAWKTIMYPPLEQIENEDIKTLRHKYSDQLFKHDDINDFVHALTSDNHLLQNFFVDPHSYHFWPLASFCTSRIDVEAHVVVSNVMDAEKLKLVRPGFVLKFEQLEEDFKLLAKMINMGDYDLPKVNYTSAPAKSVSLRDDTTAILETLYGHDYEICYQLLSAHHLSLFFN